MQAAVTSAFCAAEKRHQSLSIDSVLGGDITSRYAEGSGVLGARASTAAGNDWMPMNGLLSESLQVPEKSS